MLNNFEDFEYYYFQRFRRNKKSENKISKIKDFYFSIAFDFDLENIYKKICELNYKKTGPSFTDILKLFKKYKKKLSTDCPECGGEGGKIEVIKKGTISYEYFKKCFRCHGMKKIKKDFMNHSEDELKLNF